MTPGRFLTPREQRKYASQLASLDEMLAPGESVSLATRAEIWTARPTMTGVAALTGRRLVLSLTGGRQVLLHGFGYDEIRALKVDGAVASLMEQRLAIILSKEMCVQLVTRVTGAGGRVLGKA